eukprot:scaffold1082_cov79-Cylindrotheca_fusiformis.AAC.3
MVRTGIMPMARIPLHEHEHDPPPMKGGSDDGSMGARRLREIQMTDGIIPEDGVPDVVNIQQQRLDSQSTLGGTPTIREQRQQHVNVSQTPNTAVEEQRAAIRAHCRSDRDIHFDPDSHRKQTLLLHQASDSDMSDPDNEPTVAPTQATEGEAAPGEDLHQASDSDTDDEPTVPPTQATEGEAAPGEEPPPEDGLPTRFNSESNMLLGCTSKKVIWCFKYGVMAFAMEGQYTDALEAMNHLRRLFVRPRGDSARVYMAHIGIFPCAVSHPARFYV